MFFKLVHLNGEPVLPQALPRSKMVQRLEALDSEEPPVDVVVWNPLDDYDLPFTTQIDTADQTEEILGDIDAAFGEPELPRKP